MIEKQFAKLSADVEKFREARHHDLRGAAMKSHRFIAAVAAGLVTLGFAPSAAAGSPAPADPPTKTPIKHFVVLMQENHSFDNYFGTFPGADGIPAGTCMPNSRTDPKAGCVTPFHIGGKAIIDLDHTPTVSARQLNHGKMDGFVSVFNERNREGSLAMGYYDQRELPFYWDIAKKYVLFDKYFTSAAGLEAKLDHFYSPKKSA